MKSELQQNCYEESSYFERDKQQQQQAQPQIPDHLKCGEVYTWLCAGELYAVECKLCEDYPLCPLSEFPQHMEIWHTEWQPTSAKTEKEFMNFFTDDGDEEIQFVKENDLDNLSNDRAQSFTIEEDSGLFETRRSVESHEEALEPFEQVLIEQDLAADTAIQISEEEYLSDVNEHAAAEISRFVIEVKPQQMQTFVTQNLNLSNKQPWEERTTDKESDLQHLTDSKRDNEKSLLYPAESFVNKSKYINNKIQSKQKKNHDITKSATEAETNGSETNYNVYTKTKKSLRNFKLETKCLKQKYSKLKDIKKALIRIINNISDFRQKDETQSETSGSKNYKRNLHSKTSVQKQNLLNFTDSATSFRENEADFLNKRNRLNVKNHINKNVFKTRKKHFKKFKKSTKPKRTLKIIKKNKCKQKVFNLVTVLETKESDNEIETQTKCSESLLEGQEVESREKITKINENQKRLKAHIKELGKSETRAKETKLEKKHTFLLINAAEPDGYETEILANETGFSIDKVEINKNEKEIYVNEAEQSGIETEQNENEMQQREILTKLNEIKQNKSIARSNKNQIYIIKLQKTNKIERNSNKIQAMGSVTSEPKLCKNDLINVTSKLPNGKLKAIPNDINPIETCENETINSNLKEGTENSKDFKAKTERYLRTKGPNNLNENKVKTSENETSKDNQVIRNECETLKNAYKSKLLTNDKDETKCKPYPNKDEMKHTSSVKGTHENETHDKIPKQIIRKSPRIKKTKQNSFKIILKKQIKSNIEETDASETLPNNEILEVYDNETLLKETQLKNCLVNESATITNEINCEKIMQYENAISKYQKDEGIDKNETLAQNNKIMKYRTRDEMECLDNSIKKREVFLKRNIAKQKTINESEISSRENIEETNENETLVKHNNKIKLHENVEANDKSKFLIHNVRKSLRNVRKNPKYLQKTEKTNGIKTQLIRGEGSRTENLPNDKNKNIRCGIEQQKLKEFNSHHENSHQVKQVHTVQTSLQHSSMKSKTLLRNPLRQLSKTKQEKNELKRRFRNSKTLSLFKQKLSFRARNLKSRNLKSKEKKTVQQVLGNSKSRKITSQANQQSSLTSNYLPNSMELCENRVYPEANEISVLDLITEKEQEEDNSCLSEVPVCVEICISAQENYHENVLKQRNGLEVCKANATDAERCIKSIVTAVQAENIVTAKESDEINVFDQRDEKVIYQAKAIDIEENGKSSTITEYKDNSVTVKLSQEVNASNHKTIKAVCKAYTIQAAESEAAGSIKNTITTVYGENIVTAKESDEANVCDQIALKAACQTANNYDKQVSYCKENRTEHLAEKQRDKKALAQALALQNSISRNHDKDDDTESKATIQAMLDNHEPTSPVSPKTEEEHFEFYEPKEKLNKKHITHLIKLYREHTRLWDQSHPDFCEPMKCRASWQQITEEWNKYCKRKFTIAEVRIRICTLCQRFVQEKDRLALEGELDECAKFPYYEQMKFLEHQKSLRKRRELYEEQNEKILEIYQYFPILWHVRHYKARQAKRRAEAFESISKVLKLFGWHLSSLAVQKRIRSLRKCYRLEKIRHLHAQVEQTDFKAEFRHYERMQFLDKHIDPFVCRICGKIFEHLQGFREHLEAENHGNILQTDMNNEYMLEENEAEEIATPTGQFSIDCSQLECFTESENSTDILQRFTPFSATENNYAQQLECFPLNTPKEPLINSWQYEDRLIEEIIENVTNNDSFSQHGLDQFINSVTSCEKLTNGNSLFEEVLSPSILHTENSFIVPQPDIISDPSKALLSPLTNAESLISVDFGTENSLIVEHPHPDLIADHNFSVPQPAEQTKAVPAKTIIEKQNDLQTNVEIMSPTEELQSQVMAEKPSFSSTALLVKVQCADYSVNLKLNTEPSPTLNSSLLDTDIELNSSGDNSTAPFSDPLIHKMIEIYRKYPQLWNPNHLDFNSRILRRQAWVNLATEFNALARKQLSWRTLHRKLTDYAKYYKKLVTEQGNYENLLNKWVFYEDFKFLDDVIAVNTELQRSVHHRDNNFKIISTYKSFPQLWNIKHADFSKRSCKQRNIELMCNRLQEEYNLQLTTERLKNRLIELRAQYRSAKKQRLKCLKNQQTFSASEFEFYEALDFLHDHIDPFVCDKCEMEFKKLTDYNHHLKKEHAPKKRMTLPPAEPGMENVCHICGIKFTTRSNLMHHIKRHEGIRNYACTMCPKKFYASHALKVHIRSHTKECPYTCEKCGMSFVSASKLNQHVKRHLNQKDFECSYCPKTFFTAFEKDRHERRHLNIRDKVCPICGKTFVAGSSYYAHLMLHNDTKRFECDKCDMKFAQYPGLFKHKKRHHT